MDRKIVNFSTQDALTARQLLLSGNAAVVTIKGEGPWSKFTQDITDIKSFNRVRALIKQDASYEKITFECHKYES